MYGEEASPGVRGEDNQAEAEPARREADGSGRDEPAPSSEAAATVGRVRVTA